MITLTILQPTFIELTWFYKYFTQLTLIDFNVYSQNILKASGENRRIQVLETLKEIEKE